MGQQRTRRMPQLLSGQVEDLASDGRGVLHRDGKAVFVPDCLPGERILYRVRRRSRHVDEGALEELVEPSPDRVGARCAHFGICGGCSLQHVGPPQLAFKQKQVVDALERVGKVRPQAMAEPIQGAQWGYRRRARLGVKYVPKKGGTLVGFRERGSPFIADIERCHVLAPAVGERIRALRSLIDGLSIRTRLPQIEVAEGDNACALVLRVLDEPSADDVARLLAFSAEYGVWFYLQRGGPETMEPLSPDTPTLYYRLQAFDLTLRSQPGDFVQVNAAANEAMIGQALDWLAPGPQSSTLELFSGLGNFTLPLARRSGRVISVEGEPGLVARARANAAHNGLNNVQAYVDDLFAPDPAAAWLQRPVDAVLLDPPRSGAQAVLAPVAARNPPRILYVSCHPATLARDAGELVHERGYRLARLGVVDMFPQTAHVESMALFERG